MPHVWAPLEQVMFMQINSHIPQNTVPTHAQNERTTSTRHVRSANDGDRIDNARQSFADRLEEDFYDDTLSTKGKAMANAVLTPGKASAQGVQVSTFAIDGVQANDIVVTKRVPATAEGPNFVLYVPEADGQSFHEFKTREEMTAWVKEQASDPEKREKFAAHFSSPWLPGQVERVKEKMIAFAENDINAVVGSYGFEQGDIFTRLAKGGTSIQPPVQVNGLSGAHYARFDEHNNPVYRGYLPNGTEVLYNYDAYGNLFGASRSGDWYFVRNGLNNDEPLVPMTLKEWTRKVAAQALDNVGANDLNGMFHHFIKQLRNPGDGLAMALKEAGLPADVANSIEEIIKNPVKGTLLELNHGNRIGKLFGVNKETMDAHLEEVGGELQSRIPYYGSARDVMSTTADTLEDFGPPAPDTSTKVTV